MLYRKKQTNNQVLTPRNTPQAERAAILPIGGHSVALT